MRFSARTAFTGPPTVVRIHGHGAPVFRDAPSWSGLIGRFGDADAPGVRAIIRVVVQRISDTCGLAVPFMEYRGERSLHSDYFGRKTDEQFAGLRIQAAPRGQHRRAPGAAAALPPCSS
jgi:hypothetical protein